MEKRCKNCKYFKPLKSTGDKKPYKGWCEHHKLDMEHRVGSVGNALTVDIVGYCPFDIFVGINFGCIHFEEKKEKCDRCGKEYHEDELKSVAEQRLCEHCHYDLIGKSQI